MRIMRFHVGWIGGRSPDRYFSGCALADSAKSIIGVNVDRTMSCSSNGGGRVSPSSIPMKTASARGLPNPRNRRRRSRSMCFSTAALRYSPQTRSHEAHASADYADSLGRNVTKETVQEVEWLGENLCERLANVHRRALALTLRTACQLFRRPPVDDALEGGALYSQIFDLGSDTLRFRRAKRRCRPLPLSLYTASGGLRQAPGRAA
jgi:hypothetical protein